MKTFLENNSCANEIMTYLFKQYFACDETHQAHDITNFF